MWWRDEVNPTVFDEIVSIHEVWRAGLLPDVNAIGSTWNRFGERVLFLGIHPSSMRRLGPEGLDRRLPRFLPGRDKAWPPRSWLPLAALYDLEPSLRDLDIRSHGFVAGLAKMTLLGAPSLDQSGRSGTLGCALITATQQVATTAGHVVRVDEGDPTWGRSRLERWLNRPPISAGLVLAATSPQAVDATTALSHGIDLGLVRLDVEAAPRSTRPAHVADSRGIAIHHRCSWLGARTGMHKGWVASLIYAHNNPNEPYYRSYLLNGEIRSGAGMPGDSGSVVTDSAGAVIGHLIGVDGDARRGVHQSAWVQDAATAFGWAGSHIGSIQGVATFR